MSAREIDVTIDTLREPMRMHGYADAVESFVKNSDKEIASLREKNLALALAVEKMRDGLEDLNLCRNYDPKYIKDKIAEVLALSTSPAKQIIEDFRKECEVKYHEVFIEILNDESCLNTHPDDCECCVRTMDIPSIQDVREAIDATAQKEGDGG